MSIDRADEAEVRQYILGDPSSRRHSTLLASLRDARRLTGRNPETGYLESPANAGNWLGALGYFVVLDQIGKVFTDGHPNEVVSALRRFSSPPLSSHQLDSLYALRCALSHNYSLVNKERSKKQYWRKFRLSDTATEPLVRKAAVEWNGAFGTTDRREQTSVNLRKFGNLVERLVSRLKRELAAGTLDLALDSAELHDRYGFRIRSRSPRTTANTLSPP